MRRIGEESEREQMIKVINYLSGINVSCVFQKVKTERMRDGDIYNFNMYTLSNGYEIKQNDRNYILQKNGRRVIICFYEEDFVREVKQLFEGQK